MYRIKAQNEQGWALLNWQLDYQTQMDTARARRTHEAAMETQRQTGREALLETRVGWEREQAAAEKAQAAEKLKAAKELQDRDILDKRLTAKQQRITRGALGKELGIPKEFWGLAPSQQINYGQFLDTQQAAEEKTRKGAEQKATEAGRKVQAKAYEWAVKEYPDNLARTMHKREWKRIKRDDERTPLETVRRLRQEAARTYSAGLQGISEEPQTDTITELIRRARAGDSEAQTGLDVNGIQWRQR